MLEASVLDPGRRILTWCRFEVYKILISSSKGQDKGMSPHQQMKRTRGGEGQTSEGEKLMGLTTLTFHISWSMSQHESPIFSHICSVPLCGCEVYSRRCFSFCAHQTLAGELEQSCLVRASRDGEHKASIWVFGDSGMRNLQTAQAISELWVTPLNMIDSWFVQKDGHQIHLTFNLHGVLYTNPLTSVGCQGRGRMWRRVGLTVSDVIMSSVFSSERSSPSSHGETPYWAV